MLHRLFRGKNNRTVVQLVRYFGVAFVAFAVDFTTVYSLTDGAGVHYLVSAAVAFCLGAVTNYVLSVLWVFDQRSLSSRSAEATIFFLIGIVGLGLNELIMWIATDIAGVYYLFSKLLSTAMVFFFNFFSRKVLLFTERQKEPVP